MIHHTKSTSTTQEPLDAPTDIRLSGRVRRHSFDLVAARSGNVKRIEWHGSTPTDKTPAWFREYVRERNRLLRELSAITGRILGITTAIHGEPVMFHMLTGKGRTVRRG